MTRLAALVALVAVPAFASHPNPPAIPFEQQTTTGVPVPVGGVINTGSIQLRTAASSGTCLADFTLEFEVRPLATPFSNTVTHTSAPFNIPMCTTGVVYPYTTIGGLSAGPYHWQVREKSNPSMATSAWVPFNTGNTAFTVNLGLTASPTVVPFGNQRVGVVSQPVPVVFTNFGSSPVTISSATPSANFGASGPSLPAIVPGNGMVTFDLTVNPPALGAVSGTFVVASNDANNPMITIPLTASGALPNLVLPANTANFGDVGINTAPGTRMITVQNTGQAPLTLSTGTVAAPFGVTGLAGLNIPSGQSRTFTATFAPAAQGPAGATLTITSDDPASPHTVMLSGNGIAPQLTLSPTMVVFPDVAVNGMSAPVTITMNNPGTGAVAVGTAVTTGPFVTMGSPGPLAQGAMRTFTVTFVPTSGGLQTGTVTIPSNDASSPAVLMLSGTARAPQLQAAPASVGFGNVDLGTPQTRTLTLSNPGDIVLDVSSFAVTGPHAADFSLVAPPTTPLQIAANGGTLALTVRCAAGNHGARTAALVIQSNAAPAGPVTVPLTATGVGPKADVAPLSIAYGTVNVNAPPQTRQVTVTNGGETPLTVSAVVFSGPSGADFTTPTVFPISLTPTQSATIDLVFKPGGAGARSGNATVVSNDPLMANATVALSGTGVSPAIQVNPTLLNFGDVRVNTGDTRNVTITNIGNGPLTVSAAVVSGTGAAKFVRGALTLPLTLMAGASAQVPVTFTPTAIGLVNASLAIAADDPNQSMVNVGLIGAGVSPAMAVAPMAVDFGAQLVGRASQPRTVTLSNVGGGPLTVSQLKLTGANAASFAVGGPTLPLTISPGQSQTVDVVLTPAATAQMAGVLEVVSDDPNTPSAMVTLAGLGVSQLIAVSPMTLDFGAVKTGTPSAAKVLTLTNLSGDALSLLGAVTTGPNAGDFIVTTQGGTLGPMASTTASVTYRPQVSGASGATVGFSTSDPRVPRAEVGLAGVGISKLVDITPTALDFGDVPLGEKSQPQQVTVTNKTAQALSIKSAASSSTAFVVDPTAAGLLAAGGSRTFSVTFTPSGLSAAQGSILVTLEGASAPEQSISVTGTGVEPMRRGGCGCDGAAGVPLVLAALLSWVTARRRRVSRGGGGAPLA